MSEMQVASAAKLKPGLRVLYALGPGDLVGLFRDKQAGKLPAFQISLAYSEQFLDWCDSAGVRAHLIASHSDAGTLQMGPHVVENVPRPKLYFAPGLKHFIGLFQYGLTIIHKALEDDADVVVVDSGMTSWVVLSLLALFNKPVIGVIYSGLWPRGYPSRRLRDRVLRWLDGFYFRHFAAATVSISPECERQVRQVAGTVKGPMYQFIPQYNPEFLGKVSPVPPHNQRPFRTLFVGRVEENKGVFMILDMAEKLEKEMPGQFAWKLVGNGGADAEVHKLIAERGLGGYVDFPGRFTSEQHALEIYGWSHAMIVPTTSGFFEGLAMVAAESILAGRPAIMSTVVPANEILGDAAIVCKTDDVDDFVNTIRNLATDEEIYRHHQLATYGMQAQFYDRSGGLGQVLGRIITDIKTA